MRGTWLLRRLLGIIPTLLLTWSVVFAALQMVPGDPVSLMLGGTPASQEVIQAERHRLGLDQPVHLQYLNFLRHAVTGDFGASFTTRQPVLSMIGEQLPFTLSLAAGGLLVGAVLGTLLGVLAGLRPNGWTDAGVMTMALAGLSLPSFWIGMVLIHVFATLLGWVPVIGTGPVSLILPSITVGLFLAGGLARLIRASIIEVQGQDYIRTAHAKGLPPLLVVGKHIARNAVIPPLTLLGVQFALLIGGAVVTERVFARPGIGAMLVDAVLSKDYPLVQGIVVVTTGAYIVINLAIDLVYGLIDPRISRQ
ncbi:ABC transporter permease [Limobrevibacterium gyesilva]|uniref:ABC transporter permease n=1 Tax=Limobrevibacterium gyesilva TaxID=2991712 RepID=A0AA42CIH6_9PROT|nr:ABC transporter permease [Limobrevibacterium gyesilva]MCW3475937.1 ABC transporter permease [Limobrevibacterium gyesilva]